MSIICHLAPDIETDEEMQRIYNWVDDVPLTRPKRNIGRDFSDGVLIAEVIHHFFPNKVEIHNYQAANSVEKKEYNFKTLNQKVLRKLGFVIHDEDIHMVTRCVPGAIEKVLLNIRNLVEAKLKIDAQSRYQKELTAKQQMAENHLVSQRNSQMQHDSENVLQARNIPQQRNPGTKIPEPRSNQKRVEESFEPSTSPPVEPNEESDSKTINEYKTTIKIMVEKIKKLEQLVQIKDSKIEALTNKVEKMEMKNAHQ